MTLVPGTLVVLAGAAATITFLLGRKSRNGDIAFSKKLHRDAEKKAQEYKEVASERIAKAREELAEAHRKLLKERENATQAMKIANEKAAESKRRFLELQQFVADTLKDWKDQGALLPNLVEWSERIHREYDDLIQRELTERRVPAWRAAEHVNEARSETRRFKKEAETLRSQLSLYESLAPWLAEYTDLTVEEVLAGLKEEQDLRDFYQSGDDPVSLFVPQAEWKDLSTAERNQLALDRYWKGSRRRTAWTAGIQYERYIGYKHESDGYQVEYHGALLGLDDMGIDLICTKEGQTRVIQCKRLSQTKGIPVRENVIAQIYGAAKFYAMENLKVVDALPVLYTTYECSDTARRFAEHLGVCVFERIPFEPYPCIKCNISQLNGEKIYHLPFDQQYDATVIGDVRGEFYAMTVAEAEEAGFRRAFRWSGNVS